MKAQLSLQRILLLALVALAAACDRPSEIALAPQLDHGGNHTTVQFVVTTLVGGVPTPVEDATISVYKDASNAPTWLQTDGAGIATISVPSNQGIGYLVRLHAPDFFQGSALPVVLPPVNPETITGVAFNNLDAATCSSDGPVPFEPQVWFDCLQNRYLVPRGPTEVVNVTLETLNNINVNVADLNGGGASAYAYLITDLSDYNIPWLNLLGGDIKPGFLRFYGLAASQLQVPAAAGYLEAYGKVGDVEIAGTTVVDGNETTATIETSPVVCANGVENVVYTLSKPATSNKFTFTGGDDPAALWAFAAKRGIADALVKDLTTTVVVLKFQQSSAPTTLEINQRHRLDGKTFTASVSVVCSAGDCALENASYSMPGTGNPLKPKLYQPKDGKLFWVVEGVNPNALSEWAAKTNSDAVPLASKSNASSAFLPFSKDFTFCDVFFSFDGGWGCGI